jgi:hypothetical protein
LSGSTPSKSREVQRVHAIAEAICTVPFDGR